MKPTRSADDRGHTATLSKLYRGFESGTCLLELVSTENGLRPNYSAGSLSQVLAAPSSMKRA